MKDYSNTAVHCTENNIISNLWEKNRIFVSQLLYSVHNIRKIGLFLDEKDQKVKQAGAELCQAKHSLS